MPYLNWKEATLSQDVAPGPQDEKQRFTLGMGASQIEELLDLLEIVMTKDETLYSTAELRLDLPRGWIIFWKLRDSESRLLIAHPQSAEWVATVALEPVHAALLLSQLRTLKGGESISVGELAATGRVSNLELQLRRVLE